MRDYNDPMDGCDDRGFRPDPTGWNRTFAQGLSDLEPFCTVSNGKHRRVVRTEADAQAAAQEILATIRQRHARRPKPLIDYRAWDKANETIYLALEVVDTAVSEEDADQTRIALQALRSEVNALVDHILSFRGGR